MFPINVEVVTRTKKKKKNDESRREREIERRAVLQEGSRIVFVPNDKPISHLPSKINEELEKCFAVIMEDYYNTNSVNAIRHIRYLVNCASRELSLFTCSRLYEFFTDIEDVELADMILAAFSSWPKPSRYPLNEIRLIYRMLIHHCAGNSETALSAFLSIVENYRFGPLFMLNAWPDGEYLSRELDSKLSKKCLAVCKSEARRAYDQPLIKYLLWCDRMKTLDENTLLLSVTVHHNTEDLLTSPWVLYCRSCAEKERLAVALTILLCSGASHLPSAVQENLNCLFESDILISSVCVLALLVSVQLDDVLPQSYLSIFSQVLIQERIWQEVAGMMYFVLLSAKFAKHWTDERFSTETIALNEVLALIEAKVPLLHRTETSTILSDACLQFLCSTHPRLARAGQQLQLLSSFNSDPSNLITWLRGTLQYTRMSRGKRRRLWILPIVSYYLVCSRDLNVQETCWMILQNLYAPSRFDYLIELTRRVHSVHVRCAMVLFLFKRSALRDEDGLQFGEHEGLKSINTFMTVVDDLDPAHIFPLLEVQSEHDLPLKLLCLVKLKSSMKTLTRSMMVELIHRLELLFERSNNEPRLVPLCLLAIELLMELCEREDSSTLFKRVWRLILHSFENTDNRLVRVWICKFLGKVPAVMSSTKLVNSYAGYCSARILWFTAVFSQDVTVADTALRALRNFNLSFFDSAFLECDREKEVTMLNSCKTLSSAVDYASYIKTQRKPLLDHEWLTLISRKPSEGMFELFADLCLKSRYSDEFESFDRGLQLILNHDIHSRPLTSFALEHGLPSNIDYDFYVKCFKLYRTIIVISSSLLKKKNRIVSILQHASGELKLAIEKAVLPFYAMKVDVLGLGYRNLKHQVSDLIRRGFDMGHSVFLEELTFILNPKLSRPDFVLLIKLLRTAVTDAFYRGKGDPRICIQSLMSVLNDEGISTFFRRAIYHLILLVWLDEPFCGGSVLLSKLLSTLNPNLLLEGFNVPNRATRVSTLKYMKLVEYAAVRWQSLRMIMLCLELAKDDPRYQDAALLALFRFYQSLTSVEKNQRDFGKIYTLMTSSPNNFTFNVFILSAYKFSGIWDMSATQTLLHGIRSFPIALPVIVFKVWKYNSTVCRDLIRFAKEDQTDPVVKHAFYAGARALEHAIVIGRHSARTSVRL